jgi:mRNA-degrading endonuclease RelE of RelBE toxin-antitoxin system
MPLKRQFALIYPPIIKQHLKAIEPKYWALIRDSLEAQLRFEPDSEIRNRKPLKRLLVYGAKWEIRFGPDNRFRVFYRIDYDNQEVVILALGEKTGNRLVIGGEEIEL